MKKQAVVRAMAEVLAGLQMPISLGMQMGTAREPWGRLKDLAGFGWHDADEFERVLNEALAEQGIGMEALIKVLDDNLGSIDAERTVLSPYARGALGAIRAAAKMEGGGVAAQKERAALAEWEAAFPGAEASEVAATLEEERTQYQTLRSAAREFLDNLHHPQIGVQSAKESQLRALVKAGGEPKLESAAEIETTL